jgi:hypothetical protein
MARFVVSGQVDGIYDRDKWNSRELAAEQKPAFLSTGVSDTVDSTQYRDYSSEEYDDNLHHACKPN